MNFDISNISDLLTEKLTKWVEGLIGILPNLVLAAIVIAIGFFIAKWVKKWSFRFINRVSHNVTLNNLFTSVIYFIFIGIVLFTALNILNLDQTVTSMLAGAGILGLALAFAFQDIAANFMSGIFISFRKPIKIGDIVNIKDYMGKVVDVNLRDTVINTFGGQTVIIPNKEVFQSPIENYSYMGQRRFDLEVGVSYGENLERVRQITLDAVKGIEEISKDKETTFFYEGFGDSSINFTIRMWIDTADQLVYKKVGSEAIIAIKKAYDANDIMIPFPIRTLDFGIKGGEKLSEMQVNVANGKGLDS
ncbi:mechanosensitive ion channel family protein [Flavobacterium arcticum]|uniref:Mechanosensitive ion channel family protein n=1 Tax=Flavobacterium arcticum TaxID=1784713 RepID=A0A345HDW2_9FLAO|nr:mechanosensitive ion channel domain-containing protein [Flavobacterium arcticum]AXG74772.1 mechanosensitive ion channel family protein [Flavobacterium arcticum]KAF2509728.1 mechanosensitive ion channel [Flavobacterium arcticum]